MSLKDCLGVGLTKKNILIVDEGEGFGGSLVVAARLAQGLDKALYNPVVVTAMDIDVARDHISSDVMVYQLNKRFSYADRARIMPFVKRLKFKLLMKVFLLLLSAFEVAVNFRFQLHIIKLIKKENISLVHVNNSNDAALAAFFSGVDVVQHLHGWVSATATLSDRWHAKIPKAVIAVSNVVRDYYVDTGGDGSKVTVIHNPIAPEVKLPFSSSNALKAELGLKPERLTIGVYGRIVEWKGQLNFVKAIKLLQDKGLLFNVLIVGDDSEKLRTGYYDRVRVFCDNYLTEQNIIFTGYVSEPVKYYQVTDVVVHSSIEAEPFGLVIIEAMQNGAALLASCYGAGMELIEPGINGLISDPRDPKDIAEKLLQLVTDNEMRNKISLRARQDALKKYNHKKFANSVSEIYEALLANS